MLKVEGFTKNFGGLTAVNNLSFTVAKGQIIGLIGPNGSGKSTAFKGISGYIPLTSGHVTFDGEDITALSEHDIAKRGLTRTFQLVRPFAHLTALQNTMVGGMYGHTGLKGMRDARENGMDALNQVGLATKAQTKAKDLTIMERKWLEVARALAGRPKMLLLDEFMAGLNPAEIPQAIDLIHHLNKAGITIQRQMAELDYTPKIQFTIRAPDVPTWLDLGAAGDYVTFVPGWHSGMAYEDVAELNEKHMALMDRPADPIVGPAYAAVQVLVDAIERAGTLDRDAIRDAIAATDMDTVIGPVSFRDDGTGVVDAPILQYQNGAIELVYPPEFATADLVYPMPPISER